MKTSVLKYLGILLISLITIACHRNRIYEGNVEIPQGVWNMDSLVRFDFEIADTTIPYNLNLQLRTATYYPAMNLWLFVTIISPGGQMQRDTMECILANERGKWLGDCMGDICDTEIPYKQYVAFPEIGPYTILIQHGMRMENLPAVLETGMTVEKMEIKEEQNNQNQ